jgi:hypothetical protein
MRARDGSAGHPGLGHDAFEEETMFARTGRFSAGLLLLSAAACRATALDTDCYRVVAGHVEVEQGVVRFDGFRIERKHSSCPPLADCKFDYFVDENGNGVRDGNEVSGSFSSPSPGDVFQTGSFTFGASDGARVHYSYEASLVNADGSKYKFADQSGWWRS